MADEGRSFLAGGGAGGALGVGGGCTPSRRSPIGCESRACGIGGGATGAASRGSPIGCESRGNDWDGIAGGVAGGGDGGGGGGETECETGTSGETGAETGTNGETGGKDTGGRIDGAIAGAGSADRT